MEVVPKDLRGSGFLDPVRAASFLADLPGELGEWLPLFNACADPDSALVTCLRFHEAAPTQLVAIAEHGGNGLRRLVAVFGASSWWGDYLIADPSRIDGLLVEPDEPLTELLHAVGADPASQMPVAGPGYNGDDVRRAYRRVLLDLVADDATHPNPPDYMPEVGVRLAALADAALEAALALARRDIDPQGNARLSIIAMGKTGAQELNYISDVDVMYVVAPAEGVDERSAIELGTRMAALSAQACSGPGNEQPLWSVDANLRPEGRHGALVRTLDSFKQYWDKWAETWEFQALLKARPAAGDMELGQAFFRVASPYIWNATGRDGFVENARAMRRRVENTIPRREADRELKLGRGGLRDVEFTVQLLQLVHGRTDDSLHARSTLDALSRLGDGGYVARSDAQELRECYCFLRAVEHRIQLQRMRRTHLIPTSANELRAVGRGVDLEHCGSSEALAKELKRIRDRVRMLHEDVFYRPIVQATAGLSPDEATLDSDGAQARLQAIGYRDPRGALAHITALSQGTSRRAKIQRHLLPVFISWLSNGADPDLGLLNFRALSEQIGDSHWYLALLRDSGVAASRLCEMLPNSKWIAEALSHRPEAVAWLDLDKDLAPREAEALKVEAASLIDRHGDSDKAAYRVRAMRSRELTRAAMSDLVTGIGARRQTISDATDAAVVGALAIATREEELKNGHRVDVGFVAMGRYGGRESNYASDADVMAFHRAANGVSDSDAANAATAIINRVKALLGTVTAQMSVSVDLDLRPEGRNGPMSRTVESYAEYYDKWASTWERQALLRARVFAGPDDLMRSMGELIDRVRYGSAIDEAQIRDIRLLKARMESERLPRGIEPARHVKLGPGGLSDVEWIVQLLQLKHAHADDSLRTSSTIDALRALTRSGWIAPHDAKTLENAWSLASQIRAANVLTTGRMSGVKLDTVPRDSKDLIPLARVLGYGAASECELEEEWLRRSRKARALMDTYFWN